MADKQRFLALLTVGALSAIENDSGVHSDVGDFLDIASLRGRWESNQDQGAGRRTYETGGQRGVGEDESTLLRRTKERKPSGGVCSIAHAGREGQVISFLCSQPARPEQP